MEIGKIDVPISESNREFRRWGEELSFFNSIKGKLWEDEAYRDKFVAIRDKKVIDSDLDDFKLVKRINKKYPSEVVLIAKVEMGMRVAKIPSPRIVL